MDIAITVNTPDEIIDENIFLNSRLNLPWLKRIAPHDGHAVIVGGGPSLADDIEEIRWRASKGQKIFALNNTVQYLIARDIYPDYQVIVDARPFNARFVGGAKECLFASQCDPSVLEAGKNITLWHAAEDDMDRMELLFPDNYPAYAGVTGGTTVGLSAMTLVYAMGYRQLHLYGYDSSNRESKTHAYEQPENNDIADCMMEVFGKTFDTTLAMARQAELFPEICDILIDNGCLITVHGDGLIPWIARELPKQPVLTEQEKYTKMWAIDSYITVAPGEDCVELFLKLAKPNKYDDLLDFGCGTGRAGLKLSEHLKVTMLDFADNCLDNTVKTKLSERLKFESYDLVSTEPKKADYAYCTDVLEHIQHESVDIVLNNVFQSDKVFLQISLVPDNMGVLIGHPLHLSVHPFEWWRDKLLAYGNIQYAENQGHMAIFYISTT